jgi:hypothetical protein
MSSDAYRKAFRKAAMRYRLDEWFGNFQKSIAVMSYEQKKILVNKINRNKEVGNEDTSNDAIK